MLHKKMTDQELLTWLYHHVAQLELQHQRNECRVHALMAISNEQRKDATKATITLEEIDVEFGYDKAGMERRMVQDYWDLDSSSLM